MEELIELLILQTIFNSYSIDNEYADFLEKNYDINKMQERYLTLGKEFLKPYALNKTEKSE